MNSRTKRASALLTCLVLFLGSLVPYAEDARITKESSVVENVTHAHTNHLVNETSPYLLQHVHNPVDWYPWGEEALARSRAENKPIFLSIGYSACHWCHVMERESFENEEIAAMLNEYFISIKVDREERPDLDEIYMAAVQAMTGSGGWPMSVFLTPELRPFYGGTYFPPESRMGMPAFKELVSSLAAAWVEKQDVIQSNAEGLTVHITKIMAGGESGEGELTPALSQRAAADLERSFDPREGGWGSAPKFPSSPAIALLLREYQRTGEKSLLRMATTTLDKMAHGGMYDQIGGGFHRYSVDAQWLVPHFEKMLYDNAQLSPVYLEAYQLTGNPEYRRIAEQIFEYELRDMRDARGGFHSAEDADSEGEEGKFYIWTHAEVLEVLGKDGGNIFAAYYNVRPNGNFSSHETYHKGQNILHIARPPADTANDFGMSLEDLEAAMKPLREKLLAHRAKRVRPGLDDKVLTSWNALMITALAQGAQVLAEPKYRDAAVEAGAFILEHMMEDGTLLRAYRHSKSHLPGYLDDHAFTANAFVDLYEATFDIKWLDAAAEIADKMIAGFWDQSTGSFFFTAETHKNLLVRTKPTYDGAEPSGNSMAALALLRLGKLFDNDGYRTKAEEVLLDNQAGMAQLPRAYLRMLTAVDFLVYPPKEIAIAGERDSAEVEALLRAVHGQFVPNKVVALVEPDAGLDRKMPLLDGKDLVGGKAAAYVCKNYACQLPVTEPEKLAAQLGGSE